MGVIHALIKLLGTWNKYNNILENILKYTGLTGN